MRKRFLALFLSLLVASQVLAGPRKTPHRPSRPATSPIAHVWAQITSWLKGSSLATGQHDLPPPPSPLITGS